MEVRRLSFGFVLAASLGLCGGCFNPLSIFDENFLSTVGLGGSQAATLPGDAPAILVGVENRTGEQIEATVSFRDASGSFDTFTATVAPGDKTAQAVLCPVNEITLGDIGDLASTGVIVRLGNGTQADPFIEVEPFGILLKTGVNYDCGDSLTFTVSPSSETRSGFRTFVFVQRAPEQ